MIVLSIHLALLAFGLGSGLLLLLAIVKGTPPTVKNYSVLLLWGSFNDLVSITADLMTMERLTALWPTFIYIPTGPCTKISLGFCNLCNSLFCSMINQSVIIQCVSFWYRLHILSNPPPNTLKINMILIIFVIPNIAEMLFMNYVISGSFNNPILLKTLQKLYPERNWTGKYAFGLTDITELNQAASWGYFIVLLPIMFAYLVITRHRVLRALRNTKSMSEKTYVLHRVFLKILTIHALLPLTIIIAISSIGFMLMGIINEELEELIYVVGSFPPMVMPAITIHFMNPYKEYLVRLLFCSKMKQLSTPKTSITVKVQSQNHDSIAISIS